MPWMAKNGYGSCLRKSVKTLLSRLFKDPVSLYLTSVRKLKCVYSPEMKNCAKHCRKLFM